AGIQAVEGRSSGVRQPGRFISDHTLAGILWRHPYYPGSHRAVSGLLPAAGVGARKPQLYAGVRVEHTATSWPGRIERDHHGFTTRAVSILPAGHTASYSGQPRSRDRDEGIECPGWAPGTRG